MLRIHTLQNWLYLSDPTMEEALFEITPIRQFVRLTLSALICEITTIMNCWHLLKKINQLMRASPSSMVIFRKKPSPYLRCVKVLTGSSIFSPV